MVDLLQLSPRMADVVFLSREQNNKDGVWGFNCLSVSTTPLICARGKQVKSRKNSQIPKKIPESQKSLTEFFAPRICEHEIWRKSICASIFNGFVPETTRRCDFRF